MIEPLVAEFARCFACFALGAACALFGMNITMRRMNDQLNKINEERKRAWDAIGAFEQRARAFEEIEKRMTLQ